MKDILSFAGDRLYLHFGSLELLTPQEGDLVFAEGGIMEPGTFDPGEIACGVYRIILRNGKVFHWPQAE
ncbi:hypothetical protein FRUB_04500 [Fimbriiglobus ruber]|uniref:Uncharacterized protein n=1 Tax=Fimbriiglobus ruber TaxID=1908690 RepID=A0A225DM16_9BACT|nr:hypothetical protein FRUB_04500 [Fimbriiglobus ruber]